MDKEKEKAHKVVILLLAGISILMFFAGVVFGMTVPMKPETMIVWWIGVLGTSIMSIKKSPSKDEAAISLFVMFVFFCAIALSFLPVLYGGIVVGIVTFAIVIADIAGLIP